MGNEYLNQTTNLAHTLVIESLLSRLFWARISKFPICWHDILRYCILTTLSSESHSHWQALCNCPSCARGNWKQATYPLLSRCQLDQSSLETKTSLVLRVHHRQASLLGSFSGFTTWAWWEMGQVRQVFRCLNFLRRFQLNWLCQEASKKSICNRPCCWRPAHFGGHLFFSGVWSCVFLRKL